MVILDTCFWNWFIVVMYGGQIAINILFIIIYEATDTGVELSGSMMQIMLNTMFWLVIIITIAICIIPYIIYKRAMFFFGERIVNKIKHNKTDQLCIEKYYKKKLDQLTRATLSVAKFKKIYKIGNVDYDNLADQQMKKIVDEFKEKRKKIK